jgi:hypothetical protein
LIAGRGINQLQLVDLHDVLVLVVIVGFEILVDGHVSGSTCHIRLDASPLLDDVRQLIRILNIRGQSYFFAVLVLIA